FIFASEPHCFSSPARSVGEVVPPRPAIGRREDKLRTGGGKGGATCWPPPPLRGPPPPRFARGRKIRGAAMKDVHASMALEAVEGLAALAAAVQRLARCRAEAADLFRIQRAT